MYTHNLHSHLVLYQGHLWCLLLENCSWDANAWVSHSKETLLLDLQQVTSHLATDQISVENATVENYPKKSFYGLFTLKSSSCKQSVQLAGLKAMHTLFLSNSRRTSLVNCPLKLSRMQRAHQSFDSLSSALLSNMVPLSFQCDLQWSLWLWVHVTC